MNIQDFFKDNYLAAGNIEIVNCMVNTDDENTRVELWATRHMGNAHWNVTIELHECNPGTDNWVMELATVDILTDDELIAFVADFATIHYDEYFPLYCPCPDDWDEDDDWDDNLAEFFEEATIIDDDEVACDMTNCAYNNGGVCRYADVFDTNPNWDLDGCRDFCIKP